MRWLKQRCYSHIYGNLTERMGWLYPMLSQQVVSGSASMSFLANPISAGNLAKLQRDMGSPRSMLQLPSTLSYSFDTSVRQEHSISRSWLVQLWHEEKRKDIRRKNKRVNARNVQMDQRGMETSFFQLPFSKSVFNRQVPLPAVEQQTEILKQPPISQHDVDSLLPTSPEEVTVAPLLARSNLLITRDIEWANIMFAFEQENRYAIVDACYPGSPVGYIREQSNVIFRQTLRSRRPFIAHITDAVGNEIFRVRRPFWLINSTIYVEVNGKEVGVVHRRWHLWRRIYDLYLGNKQFAVVENPGFWNWTFTLKDDEDKVLAQIDRDWRGVGLELFTDAGQYVIRFGDDGSSPKFGLASSIQELEVARPLTLSERAVALALAVSLDNDYFSRRGGWGLPLLIAGE